MDNHTHKSTFLDGDDAQCIFTRAVESTIAVFIIMQIVIHIDRFLHVLCRICLPALVHPKLSDVFSSPICELDYPLVAIQLPMMNEIDCCESAIECACNLDWPKSRLVVQVLDDSTDKETKRLINSCVQKWTERGVQINVYRRPNRVGFKAGNLAYGMSFICDAKYIAIFDVDFLPTKDYLLRTLPTLIHDPTVAFVQARWTFTNSKETILTYMQEISLNFHHKCEQEGRSRASLFFTFNGTAGVWRTSAIEQSGGWHKDTLVEDLDLSLRAYLNGWRSVYIHDLECLNELPSTLPAYLSQQHRWISGPMQVTKKLATTIYQSRHIPWHKKLYCMWYLFRSCFHIVNLISLAVIMPLSILRTSSYIYDLIYFCLLLISSVFYAAFTSDEIHLVLLNTLFSNAMSLNNTYATISGLLNSDLAKEWIVTPKFGCESNGIRSVERPIGKDILRLKLSKNVISTSYEKNINGWYLYCLSFGTRWIAEHFQWTHRRIHKVFRPYGFYERNFWMAIYLLVISYLAFEKQKYFISIYMFSNSMMYFILAFGYMGRQIEQSKYVL